MCRNVALVLIIPLVSALCSSLCIARGVESWPYDKLFKSADVVVIAKVISVTVADDDVAEKKPRAYFKGVLTTFEVKYVMKGDHKDKRIEVFHYGFKENEKIPDNGPMLVSFHKESMEIHYKEGAAILGEPQYMIFLKKRKDGRYECVSGQFDPLLSVKQILEPLRQP